MESITKIIANLERIPIFNEMQDNTTPKQKREAMISLLGKAVDEFLEK
ncbi:hypothetical protein [Bacillus thuringiensis]|nr:hypothetical protein [Bacillus thuringiensis]